MDFKQWEGFNSGSWENEINVRDFIRSNYTPYEGDENFLVSPTEKTLKLWNKVLDLYTVEKKNGGVLDVDTFIVSTISSHEAGYIDKSIEEIVGLQTDQPLKRAIMPMGGIRVIEKACSAYGLRVSDKIKDIYHNYRRTHNDGVFTAYTPEIRAARSSHVITRTS